MSESSLSRYVREGMKGRWDMQRHEDRSPYIPDISFGLLCVQGWIELKEIPHWPVKSSTIVRINNPTRWKKQKEWLQRRGRTGAACFLLLRVERTYLLIDWQRLDKVGKVPEKKLRDLATPWRTWELRIDFDQFSKRISGD